MRKNQKNSKEDMYTTIEGWLSSGQSQYKISKELGISRNTFKYWLNKYRKEKDKWQSKTGPFIPIQVSTIPKPVFHGIGTGMITIIYPNGVQLSCPANISIQQLRTLINL